MNLRTAKCCSVLFFLFAHKQIRIQRSREEAKIWFINPKSKSEILKWLQNGICSPYCGCQKINIWTNLDVHKSRNLEGPPASERTSSSQPRKMPICPERTSTVPTVPRAPESQEPEPNQDWVEEEEGSGRKVYHLACSTLGRGDCRSRGPLLGLGFGGRNSEAAVWSSSKAPPQATSARRSCCHRRRRKPLGGRRLEERSRTPRRHLQKEQPRRHLRKKQPRGID
jgi:hypothetical protein